MVTNTIQDHHCSNLYHCSYADLDFDLVVGVVVVVVEGVVDDVVVVVVVGGFLILASLLLSISSRSNILLNPKSASLT